MAKTTVQELLKDFGLTDDQILEIAVEPRLLKAKDLLQEYLWKKWNMDTLTAMKTVKTLREELN